MNSGSDERAIRKGQAFLDRFGYKERVPLNTMVPTTDGAARRNPQQNHPGRKAQQVFPLSGPGLLLLGDVINHPDIGMGERYKRLGWGASKGGRVKKELIDKGFAREVLLSQQKGRDLMLLGPSASALDGSLNRKAP